MKYQDWLDDELEGYHEAGLVSEIDRETVEDDPKYNTCQECGSKLKYEGWKNRDGSSYRALAICTNPECQETFEF